MFILDVYIFSRFIQINILAMRVCMRKVTEKREEHMWRARTINLTEVWVCCAYVNLIVCINLVWERSRVLSSWEFGVGVHLEYTFIDQIIVKLCMDLFLSSLSLWTGHPVLYYAHMLNSIVVSQLFVSLWTIGLRLAIVNPIITNTIL